VFKLACCLYILDFFEQQHPLHLVIIKAQPYLITFLDLNTFNKHEEETKQAYFSPCLAIFDSFIISRWRKINQSMFWELKAAPTR